MLTRRRHRGLGGAASFYRFDSARSCQLQRTPSVAGNRQKWTWSVWVKRTKVYTASTLLHAYTSASDYFYIYFDAGNNRLELGDNTGTTKTSSASFFDPSSWLHVCIICDTTLATAEDRLQAWVNGVRITAWGTNTLVPAQNASLTVNSTAPHRIGGFTTGAYLSNDYFSDVYFIDGQALTPSSFGQASPGNPNVWVPKTPLGLTYGTNGFHLAFANAAALGTDTSGNGNTYTSSGLTTSDQFADTPTNNYCTLSPIDTGPGTLSNGNLTMTVGSHTSTYYLSTSGKYSWKYTQTAAGNLGIINTAGTKTPVTGANNDVTELELDLGAGTLNKRVNGGGSTSVATGLAGTYSPYFEAPGTVQFNYTPADGTFKNICTANMPTPLPAIVTSGSFTGNVNADGPFIYTKGTPETLTINGNAVTWGTHANKLANGFKLQTASTSYNSTGTNTWTATATSDMRFPLNNAQGNP